MSDDDNKTEAQEGEQPKEPPVPISGYITELSDEEVLKLTDEDLSRMIRLKMAAEGIKMLKKPQEPKLHEIPPKDMTLYSVNDTGYIAFKDKHHAIALLEAMTECCAVTSIVRCYGYSEKLDSEEQYNPSLELKTNQVYSPALYAKVRGAIKENESMKDEYEKTLKEYKRAEDEAAWIREEVYGKFRQVRHKYEEMDVMNTRYDEYLVLAEGNEEMAWKFLRKAHSINEETEAYIKSHKHEAPKKTQKKAK